MADQSGYKVKIEGDGLALDREISKEIGDKILVLIYSGTAQPVTMPKSAGPVPIALPASDVSPQEPDAELAIREFLDQHNAKRNADIITAIGSYLNTYNDQRTFTKEDLLNMFEAAEEPAPANPGRDLKWAINVGWVAAKRGQKDTYYVTASGKNAVDSMFPDGLIKKTKLRVRAKKASAQKGIKAVKHE
jgi:hypothetical protein